MNLKQRTTFSRFLLLGIYVALFALMTEDCEGKTFNHEESLISLFRMV